MHHLIKILFNTITKSEGGLMLAGEGDIFDKNPDTGEIEESDNVMEVATAMAVGPDVKYVKEGDVIYYRRVQKVPIPFFRSGLIAERISCYECCKYRFN